MFIGKFCAAAEPWNQHLHTVLDFRQDLPEPLHIVICQFIHAINIQKQFTKSCRFDSCQKLLSSPSTVLLEQIQ